VKGEWRNGEGRNGEIRDWGKHENKVRDDPVAIILFMKRFLTLNAEGI
jgi:hypothetical protein